MNEKPTFPKGEDKFNLGLSNQEHIENLFETANQCRLANNPYTAAKAILGVKRIITSEQYGEDRDEIESRSNKINVLLKQFENLVRRGAMVYDVNTARYKIIHNKSINVDAFEVYDNLEIETDKLEEKMRLLISHLLFPKKKGAEDAIGG